MVETMDRYIEDGLHHLNNPSVYLPLENDITDSILKNINKYLLDAHNKGYIDKETYQHLLPPNNVRTPVIYFLKKLHKNPISVRPIVSNISSPTSNISAFIDTLLKPIVASIPQILTNSQQLIRELSDLPPLSHPILVSFDVVSLYTNIPTTESITTILHYIKEHNNPTYPPATILEQLLQFILNQNCFQFCNHHFLQQQGIAMGTKMAPNYANLFMAHFEENNILNQELKPLLYRRYIDDIFIVWSHGPEELQTLFRHANRAHHTIKFTIESSTETIHFLDLTLSLTNNRIETTTYFKPTNNFSYIPGNSFTPPSIFKGVFTGETIRMLRNNSTETNYHEQSEQLRQHFTNRHYPQHLLNQSPPAFSDRHQLLTQTKEKRKFIATMSTNYDPSTPISTILNTDWPRLTSDPDIKRIVPIKPTITYRSWPNLQKLLTKAKTDHTIIQHLNTSQGHLIKPKILPSKNISCRHPQCTTCNQLSNKTYFHSHQRKTYHQISDIYSCDSKNIVYLLECNICQKQYIGQTGTSMRVRMRHHRNMAKANTKRPIYLHNKQHGIEFNHCYQLTIIDKATDYNNRIALESRWINDLRTKLPFGLNVIHQTHTNA